MTHIDDSLLLRLAGMLSLSGAAGSLALGHALNVAVFLVVTVLAVAAARAAQPEPIRVAEPAHWWWRRW